MDFHRIHTHKYPRGGKVLYLQDIKRDSVVSIK